MVLDKLSMFANISKLVQYILSLLYAVLMSLVNKLVGHFYILCQTDYFRKILLLIQPVCHKLNIKNLEGKSLLFQEKFRLDEISDTI